MTPPAAAPAVRARPLAPTRPLGPSRRPRRVSGPARPASRPSERFARPARTGEGGLALGVAALARAVARHRLLDRLIRGRAWIVLIAFALIGIVTLQLALLKLNAGIGRSLERGALLQRENATLSIENSELAGGSRVEAAAEHLGMTLVPTGLLKFLNAGGKSDTARAAVALSAPAHAAGGEGEAGGASALGESSSSSSSSSLAPASTTEAPSEASRPTSSSTSASAAEATSSGSGGEAGAAAGQSSGEARGGGAASSETGSAPAAGPTSGAGESGAGGGTQAAPGG